MKRMLHALLCIGAGIVLPNFATAQLNANFSANTTSGCSPIVVQFTDQTTGGATSWQWDLGNGTTSTLQNPSTSYITPGYYTVRLIATGANGADTEVKTNYINAMAAPTVAFAASDSAAVCAPANITFTNLSGTSGTPTYLWDFGDGTTSIAANPSHNYTTTGNYNVTLVVTNGNGCNLAIQKTSYIHTVAAPLVDFSATNTSGCSAPITTSFTNVSTGAASYTWSFGDGGTAISASPSHTYTTAGTYTVTLIGTSSNGCTDTMVKPSFINFGNLNATFTASTNNVCAGTAVSFTNTTTGGTSSTWYFGDGTSLAATNASHVYSTPGTYTATLVASNGVCSDSAQTTIVVNGGPAEAFTATNTSGCTSPFATQFNNTTTGATSYLWIFGDGTTSTNTSPSHSYTAAGSFTVQLIATNAGGCSDTLTKSGYINIVAPTATLVATPLTGCAPAVITLTPSVSTTATITSFSYNYGDGTSGSSNTHTFTTAGSYTITYSYTLSTGCSGTKQTTVTLGAHPTASFTNTADTVCPQTNISFTNTSSGATAYIWYFGNGGTSTQANPTYYYGNPGLYNVTLVAANNGCFDTLVKPNLVLVMSPTASFNSTYNCANRYQVSFTNTSSNGTSYTWAFGDGTTSAATNPTHTYSSFGTYTVTLTTYNATTGCTNTAQKTITIFGHQPLAFTADTAICKYGNVNFATTANSNISSYTWSMGDGSTVFTSGTTASHIYSALGSYTISLKTTDLMGCADSLVKPGYVHVTAPAAAFSAVPLSGCAPLNTYFTNQSTGNGAPVTTLAWSFGDGGTGTVFNPAHTYATGTYSVTLIATDANGCKDTIKKNNYIAASKPHAQFAAANPSICKGAAATFVNASTGNGNLSYYWTFGDGSSSTNANPSHVYTSAGTYTVTLIVNDGGCTDTLVRPAYIQVNTVNVGFTVNDSFATCPPLVVNCTNAATGTASYSWTFGNGNTSVLANPTSVYTYPGTYTITQHAQTAGGCADSAKRTVTVLGPTGTFTHTITSGCMPVSVAFASVGQNVSTYTWDMNNGVTQTTSTGSFSYTYTQPGRYVPILIISNGACQVPIKGDTITTDHLVTHMSSSPDSLCRMGTIAFTDSVDSSYSAIVTRYWTFGDGTSASTHNPSHTYTAPGTYHVKLLIQNAAGCTDTLTKLITILAPPNVTATAAHICHDQANPAQLQASGAAAYTWLASPSLSCTTCANPTALPDSTTTYTVIGTAANGCKDTVTTVVTVYALPNVTAGANQVICANAAASLHATGAVSYVWSPATSLSCAACAAPTAHPDSTTTYVVTGTNANGCTDTGMVTVTINTVPDVTAGANKTICKGLSTQLQATGNGALSYSWSPAATLSCGTCSNPVASPVATTTYNLITQNSNGCSDTSQVTVAVSQPPTIDAGTQQVVCAGSTAQLQASGAVAYVWAPAAGLSCTTCANPVASPASSIQYTITGTDANGCTDSTQLLINVIQHTPTSISSNVSVCRGQSARLTATGGSSYQWIPSDGLNDDHLADPTATPDNTTTYKTFITENQCFTDTAEVTVMVNPVPTVKLGGDQTLIAGGSVPLFATTTGEVITYAWTPSDGLSCADCQGPTAAPTKTTRYTLTVANAAGCEANTDATVNIKCDNSQVFIPNTFTPNGDGNNDRFYINGKGIASINRFSVYNRWGELMYQADNMPMNDEHYGWDGTFKGEQLKPDVFVYIISATCESGDPMEFKGDISLIR